MLNDNAKRTFLNRREWGSYLSALQSAASYPRVVEAVKSGRDLCTQGATQASSWLVDSAPWLVGSAPIANKLSIG